MPVAKKILVVLESRPFLAESIQTVVNGWCPFDRILLADDIQSALKCGIRKSPVSLFFLVCGVSLLRMEAIVEMIRACFPSSSIVLLDERIRQGCCLIVDRVDVQGYCSLYDSSDHFLTTLDEVASGTASVAPSVKHLLSVDDSRKIIVSKEEHRKSPFHELSQNEWLCFRHLLSGGELPALARQLNLEPRTVHNIKYRMLKKLSLSRAFDLFPLALQWGFLDHAGLQSKGDSVE